MKKSSYELTEDDRKVLRVAQKNFGFSKTPFDDIARELGFDPELVLEILKNLMKEGVITRVGPFFNLDKSSGYVTLVAMKVPEERFKEVSAMVNSYVEVAHNYKRKHEFNMWFVLGAHSSKRAFEVLGEIEKESGLSVINLPKLKEFNLDLYLEV